uniref:Uncharacterized protein n=1 Tax=Bactrocera latifrons TaxID=174628 RepID=A0A0K8VPF5_BACLA
MKNTDNIQAENDINNNCNGTSHHKIIKNMNLCIITWKYSLAILCFVLVETNSTWAKSQDAVIPLTEMSMTITPVVDSLSTTTKTALSQNPMTTPSILATEYTLTPITKFLVKTVYGMTSSTPPVSQQSIPISLPSTVSSKQTSSLPDDLSKGFSIPTLIPPLSPFAIDQLTKYSPPTPSIKPLTSSMSTKSEEQLYAAAYQQNRRRLNFSLATKNITVQLGNHAYLSCNVSG